MKYKSQSKLFTMKCVVYLFLIFIVLFSIMTWTPLRNVISRLCNLEQREYARWGLFPLLCALISFLATFLFYKLSQLVETRVWGYKIEIDKTNLLIKLAIIIIIALLVAHWLKNLIVNDMISLNNMEFRARLELEINQYIFAGESIFLGVWYSIRRIYIIRKLHLADTGTPYPS